MFWFKIPKGKKDADQSKKKAQCLHGYSQAAGQLHMWIKLPWSTSRHPYTQLKRSIDEFQQQLGGEESFIDSQVSRVLGCRSSDEVKIDLKNLLEQCRTVFPGFLRNVDSHLATLDGFDKTASSTQFQTAFKTHRENVERIKKLVEERLSAIDKDIVAWQKIVIP
jgi:hypothetical protein